MSDEAESHRFVVCVPADALATLCDAYVALTGGRAEQAAERAPGPTPSGRRVGAHAVLDGGVAGPSLAAADEAYDTLTAALPTEQT